MKDIRGGNGEQRNVQQKTCSTILGENGTFAMKICVILCLVNA
jgi:hypothetical protein